MKGFYTPKDGKKQGNGGFGGQTGRTGKAEDYKNSKDYPWLEKREPLGIELPADPYVIDKVPDIGATPSINWLQVLCTPVAMIAISIVMMSMGTSNMLMMLPMQLVGVIAGVLTYLQQKKKFGVESKDQHKMYSEYLDTVRSDLKKIAYDQKKMMIRSAPGTEKCLEIIRKKDVMLWSRDSRKDDFLSVSLGTGTAELCCPIDVYRPGRFDKKNDLVDKAVQIADDFKTVDDVPVILSLSKHNAVAVTGDPYCQRRLLQQMLVSLCTVHSPEDLKIAIAYTKKEKQEWSFFRFLPHVWDADRSKRFVADDAAHAEELLSHFADMAKARQEDRDCIYEHSFLPYYLLVVTEQDYLNGITDSGRLFPDSRVGLTTVVLCKDSIPPAGCRFIIDVASDDSGNIAGKMFSSGSKNVVTEFQAGLIYLYEAEEAVREMSPIRLKSGKEGKGLPKFVSLFAGRGINSPEEMEAAASWRTSRADKSMAVPIGIGKNGKEVFFDIHEKADGPMGIVAGTTRAGKTELIQTWIIQMASKYSPQEVNFVLFDFKGTSLIEPLIGLPHLVGYISNIGPDDSGQDFEMRYCAALKSEIARREELIGATEASNFLGYQEKYHANMVSEPLPFLFIVLDEFARIKDAHPEFMKLANELYATGGGLGMYVILSTQDPASAITTEIEANTAFRLCARVANSQGSTAMIGVKDAAELPKIPGRAFLSVRARGTLQCFQGFFAGAKYEPKTRKSENAMPTALLETDGSAVTLESKNEGCTELKTAVQYLKKTAENMQLPQAHKVWLQPLERNIGLFDVLKKYIADAESGVEEPQYLSAVSGMTDDPANQSQYPTVLPLSEYGGALVCGGTKSGKTFFLISAALSVVMRYSPQRVRMYYFADHSGDMQCMSDFPHTARIISSGLQPDKCASELEKLKNEMVRRQNIMAAQGGIASGSEQFPYILLIIDDIGDVKKSLEDSNLGGAFDTILNILKSGPRTGIYMLISAGRTGDIYKFSTSIHPDMRFVLRMPDSSDAREILNLSSRPPFIRIPGRGLLSKTSANGQAFVFQAAVPFADCDRKEQFERIAEMGLKMKEECGVSFNDQPVEIPEHIPYGSLTSDQNGIVLGLALNGNGAVCHFRSEDTSVLTLAGTDAGRIDSVSAMVLRQAEQSGTYEKIIRLSQSGNSDEAINGIRQFVNANSGKEKPGKAFLFIQDFPGIYNGLSPESRTVMDKVLIYGGKSFNIDCLLTARPDAILSMAKSEANVIPAKESLFRRGMLYTDSSAAGVGKAFFAGGIHDGISGPEDADYVNGMDDGRTAVRIRCMSDC